MFAGRRGVQSPGSFAGLLLSFRHRLRGSVRHLGRVEFLNLTLRYLMNALGGGVALYAEDLERRHEPNVDGAWCEVHQVSARAENLLMALRVGRHVETIGVVNSAKMERSVLAISSPGIPPRSSPSIVPAVRETASFNAMVSRPGADPLVISDNEIVMPDKGWELRSSGLWADHNCEAPMEHWSYGLEAFALAVDDPEELLGRALGIRTPLGWELDFESSTAPSFGRETSYAQAGRLHGFIQFAGGDVEIDAEAERSHRWGPTEQAADTAEPSPGPHVALPTPEGIWRPESF